MNTFLKLLKVQFFQNKSISYEIKLITNEIEDIKNDIKSYSFSASDPDGAYDREYIAYQENHINFLLENRNQLLNKIFTTSLVSLLFLICFIPSIEGIFSIISFLI